MMTRVPNIAGLVFLLAIFAFGVSDLAVAKTVFVAKDAPGNGSGSSWEDGCPSISKALTASSVGDEIWVKMGTYYEAITLKEAVSVYGGFVGTEESRDEVNPSIMSTTIDARGLNSPVVIGADQALIDGFTLVGGDTENGGGIYMDSIALIVKNCRIMNNSVTAGGAGVYCSSSSLTLLDCVLSDNAAGGGGGIYCKDSSLTLIGCVVQKNSASAAGGGLDCHSSSFILTNCIISGNSAGGGGGIYALRSSGKMEQCEITGNSARFGGGVACLVSFDWISYSCESLSGDVREVHTGGWSPTLINCVIAGNTASDGRGGAVFCDNTVPVFENCTIAGNTGAGVYSRMYYYDEWNEGVLCGCAGFPKLVNTILWDNQPWQTEWKIIRYEDSETLWPGRGEGWQMTYSCVRGGWPGEGNVESDPLFVDPAAGDYRLQPGSPCIDSGSNEAVQDVSLDLDGRIRVWNGGSGLLVDMGAYETASWTPEGVRSDLNGDGKIDQEDLFLFQQGWHKTATPVPTP